MAFNINQFASALKNGGVRSSLFQVQLNNPINGVADIKTPFMVKAATIPGAELNNIPVRYMGRSINVAGQRGPFPPWEVLVINDDFSIRHTIEQWNNAINSFQGNLNTLGGSSPSLYKADAQITQYSTTGEILRVYNFVGLYPQVIAPMQVSWEQEGIQEFGVTFQYDYWQVVSGVTGTIEA